MLKRSLLAASMLAATISNVHALPYGFYDARSVAMGNVSVATGGITTAALSNPGMLSINETDDTFAMLLPAIGVQAIDDGELIDKVDDFQALETTVNDAGLPAQTRVNAILDQIDILNALDGSSVIVGATPNLAFVYSGDSITMGVTARANAVVSAGLVDVNLPTGTIVPTDNPTATVTSLGVLTTEVGLPIGTDLSFAGMKVAFGVTPKLVQVDVIEFDVNIENSDVEDVVDENEQDLGSFTTLDAGVTIDVLDTLRVGLVAKNLIEETKTTALGRDIDFETHLRAGVAFDAGFMTLAADMDLTEIDPVHLENPSKSFSVGAEFDVFNIAQLRAGYQTNMASGATDPDLLSVGVGLWLGFHLDAAVVVGEDSSFGAFVQTGFRF